MHHETHYKTSFFYKIQNNNVYTVLRIKINKVVINYDKILIRLVRTSCVHVTLAIAEWHGGIVTTQEISLERRARQKAPTRP